MNVYFTRDEILHGRDAQYPLTEEMEQNLEELIYAMSRVREAYGKPLVCSSGYRPSQYNSSAGGAKLSAHQDCQAVDILDVDGLFANWCMNNIYKLKEAGILAMEDPRYTMILNSKGERISGWVHLQIRPTSSRTFVFIPYSGNMKLEIR